jgi:hypothetical protein
VEGRRKGCLLLPLSRRFTSCTAPRRGGISSSPVTPGSVTPYGVPSPGATAQRPLRGSRPDRERCAPAAAVEAPPVSTVSRGEPRRGGNVCSGLIPGSVTPSGFRHPFGVPSPGATAQRPLRGSCPAGDAQRRVSPSRRLTPSGLPSRSGPSPTGSQTLSRTLIAQFLPNEGRTEVETISLCALEQRPPLANINRRVKK